MKISILMPSIRPSLLQGVYESIEKSCHVEWEIVLISPYAMPDFLKDKNNVQYIFDKGSPIRARQIGLIASKGDYICYAADDVTFYPNSLDIAYNTLKDKDYKSIVLGKYLEGEEDNPFMKSDEYYFLYTHDFLKPIMVNFPRDYKLLNTGLISRKVLLEIGGFDCMFEACAMSCVDLSIRLQNYGCPIIIQNEPIFHSTHLPYGQGDHEPIHIAQVGHDQPLFLMLYLDHKNKTRTIIPLDNWEKNPSIWKRRFGNKSDLETVEIKSCLSCGRAF